MARTSTSTIPTWRRLPIGVEPSPNGTAHARVWAPGRTSVELVTYDDRGGLSKAFSLTAEDGEYFSGCTPDVGPGTRYRFRLDGGDAFPDPASRYQPDGTPRPS